MGNPTLKITSAAGFQQRILSFPARNLPWRQISDPYAILVSEIMLQQTQVDRVIPFYLFWLQCWPTVHSLARAPLPAVLEAWQGLGYNRRALHLHQSAKIISENYAGDVLRALQSEKLPGIGPYTIRAIQIFSQNKNLATVDTNIRRILIHEFRLPESTPDKELLSLAQSLVPPGRSRDWHNALMDYGSVLTSRRTGISPKTKQSRFEGSDRQLRAKILRAALKEKSLSFQQLSALEPSPARLKKVLASLERDRLLVRQANRYAVPKQVCNKVHNFM